MQISRSGDNMVLKFDSKENLFENLKDALKDSGCGWAVLVGIGMLKNAEIGYFDGDTYQKTLLKKPHELVALHGTVTTQDAFTPHLHCGLVGPDFILKGGHLFSADVEVVCEMILVRLDTRMTRKEDPSTGLKLLELK